MPLDTAVTENAGRIQEGCRLTAHFRGQDGKRQSLSISLPLPYRCQIGITTNSTRSLTPHLLPYFFSACPLDPGVFWLDSKVKVKGKPI
jgi:hypothetical protein